MDETLRQIGQLLLGAVPTVVLFGLLYLSYRVLLHKPLEAVLEERRSRTQGAIAKAQADIVTADGREAEYEQRLKDARVAIYQAQESRRRRFQEATAAALAEARAKADAMVRETPAGLEKDVAAARTGLEAESDRLAAAVIQTILKPAGGAAAAAGGRS
jgi:F-type H+-transporting ATPase subunit b